MPFFIKPITRTIGSRIEEAFLNPNYKTHFDFLEGQLASSGGDFFCGKTLSCADVMLIFPLEAALGRAGLSREKHPTVAAWVDRIHEREAYKAAVKKVEEATGEKFSMSF